jgi:O-antigen ligase
LRFFEFTNETEAVGFFANRNHFAALLYALTVFAAAFAVEATAIPVTMRTKLGTRRIVPIIASFTVLVTLVAGQAIARSRAGLGLTMVALLGCMALAASDRRTTSGITPSRLLGAAAILALIFAAQFTLYRLMDRFSDDPLKDSRIIFARLTLQAAKLYMPFGSGMGTFVPVYATFEKPHDALLDAYVNRAHNDVLELWLEAGVPGLGLMAIFLVWLTVTASKVWRRNTSDPEIDIALARAATIVLGLMITHCFFDYPLRTGAVMAILAFACGLLITPAKSKQDDTKGIRTPKQRQARSSRPTEGVPAGAAAGPQARPPGERWGADINWPKEWRQKQ